MKWFIWIFLFLLAFEALAQEPQVPAELLKPRRRLQGNQITFCINQAATLYNFDQQLGEAIAQTLLLKPRFVKVTYAGFGLLDDGDLMTNLFVDLTNSCDAAIGFNLSAGGYPDWLGFTRAYSRIPYVLAVKNPAYKNLGDIPKGKAIGSGLSTSIDAFFGAYNRSLPENNSWQRIPYGDFDLMIRRLKEGKLEGALIWGPTLNRIAHGDPEKEGLFVRPTNPIQTVESNLGLALRAKDVSLRTMLDGAVSAVIKDGTVARLLRENGIAGEAGSLENIQPQAKNLPSWLWVVLAGAVIVLAVLARLRPRRRAI